MTRVTLSVLSVGLLLTFLAVARPPQQQTTEPQTPSQTASPQPEQAPPPMQFSVGTQEVILPITVTDEKGRFVDKLEKSDFRILDEGRPQEITYFFHDTPGTRQQTVIGFLLDMSSNSLMHWDKFKDATKEMIWNLLPSDKNFSGYLIAYSTTAELAVNTTWQPDTLTERVDRLKPAGGSALFDAVHMACTDRTLVPGEPYQPRRVIVVIGDGHDNASKYTLDQVIELALRNQVTIYGVSNVAFGSDSGDKETLERLARETGGHVEYPLNNPYSDVAGAFSTPSDEGNYALHVGTGGYAAAISSAINKSVQALQGEITTQYVIRYRPDIDPATAYKEKRRIDVSVRTLPVGSVKIQTRPAYYPYRVRQ